MLNLNHFVQSSLNAPLPTNEIYMAETNILRVQCTKQFFVYQAGVAVPNDPADILKIISVLIPAEVFSKERIRQSQVSKVIQNYFAMIQEELSLILAKYETTFNLNLVFSLFEKKCKLKDIDLFSCKTVLPNLRDLGSIIGDDIAYIISKRGSDFDKEDFTSLIDDAKNYLLSMAVEWSEEPKSTPVPVVESVVEDEKEYVTCLSTNGKYPLSETKNCFKFFLGKLSVFVDADFFHEITQNTANLLVKEKATFDEWVDKLPNSYKEILENRVLLIDDAIYNQLKLNPKLKIVTTTESTQSIKRALLANPDEFGGHLATVLIMLVAKGASIEETMFALSAFLPVVNPEPSMSYFDKTLFLDFKDQQEVVVSIQMPNILPSEKIQRLMTNAAKSVSIDTLKLAFPNKTVTNAHLKMAVMSKPKDLKAFKDIANLFR